MLQAVVRRHTACIQRCGRASHRPIDRTTPCQAALSQVRYRVRTFGTVSEVFISPYPGADPDWRLLELPFNGDDVWPESPRRRLGRQPWAGAEEPSLAERRGLERRDAKIVRRYKAGQDLDEHRRRSGPDARAHPADRQELRRSHAARVQVRRQGLLHLAALTRAVLCGPPAPTRPLRRPSRLEGAAHRSAWNARLLQGWPLLLRSLPKGERGQGA